MARHYLLNGQKMWITNGGFADLFTIFAKVDGEKFTAFLVERGMGVVSGHDERKLGLDGSSTTALMLDNVKVPVENVLGTIGEGHKVAFNILNFGRVKLGDAQHVPASGWRSTSRSPTRSERRQFGKAIAEFGLIKQKLAEMAVRCFVGDAMVYRTLGDVDRALEAGDPADTAGVLKTIEAFAVECSINKVATSEALAYAVDEAVQVFGGNGYSREFPVERAYRDARITRIYEGTNEINRLIIPTRLLKQGESILAQEVTTEATGSAFALASFGATGLLEAQRQALTHVKRLARTALATAGAAFGGRFASSRRCSGTPPTSSSSVTPSRAQSAGRRRSPRGAASAPSIAVDIARVYTSDAMDRVAHAGKQIVNALAGYSAPMEPLIAAVGRVREDPGVDTVGARRRIADAAITRTRYPF